MSAGSSTTKTVTEPWDEQKPFLERGFQRAEALYGARPGGIPYYGGATLAGFDPAQQAGQRMTMNYAMGPRAMNQQMAAEANINQMQSGGVNTGVFNPMMNVFQQQMQSSLQNKTLPQIRSSLVNYNPGGSTKGNQIQSQAIAAANQQMLNKAAEMQYNAYDAAQGRRVDALGQYPTTMTAPFALAGAVDDIGAERRAMTQAGIDRDMARYEYQQLAPQVELQNYLANISGDYGSTQTSTGRGPSPLGSLMTGLAGKALMGPVGGILGGLF